MIRLVKFILTSVIAVTCSYCSSNDPYIPERVNLSEYRYNLYLDRLATARANNNSYKEGVELANLYAPSDLVREAIIRGIKEDSTVCHTILELDSLLNNFQFETNLYNNNPNYWEEYFSICNEIVSLKDRMLLKRKNAAIMKEIEDRKKASLDSSRIDIDLIEVLEDIYEKDQEYRRIGLAGNPLLGTKQRERDSVNFLRLDSIFRADGFPELSTIGEEGMTTIWLVAHHQTNQDFRMKFDVILAEQHAKGNISDIALSSFRTRSHEMFSE